MRSHRACRSPTPAPAPVPAAAALQYGIERDFTNRTEMVVLYDLGAASLQAALVTYSAYTNPKVQAGVAGGGAAECGAGWRQGACTGLPAAELRGRRAATRGAATPASGDA